jgi:hypothetical protein
VRKLLHEGAWRLSRTCIGTGSSKIYSTPLQVAQDHEWEHLYELLNPVIRRPVSYKILQILQDRLHDLIKQTYAEDTEAHLECFLLPELEILTEFDRSRLWFPLEPELPDTRYGRAVHIILEGSELVVVMRWVRSRRKNYRVTVDGVQEIEQAIVLR